MSKHPDYNYAPTNPIGVRIYDTDLIPQQEFLIIGKMTIDATWSLGAKQTAENIQSKAAMIGGDGVIITDKTVNIYAFNRGTTTEGTVWGTRNWLQYQQTTRDNTLYIPQVILYGYVIKFKAQQATKLERNKNKWTAYKDGGILLNEYDTVYLDIKTGIFHFHPDQLSYLPMRLDVALKNGYKPCPLCIPIEHEKK